MEQYGVRTSISTTLTQKVNLIIFRGWFTGGKEESKRLDIFHYLTDQEK